MNRRALIVILALALTGTGQARADEPVDRILRDLKRLGYQTVSVERTLLRRTRILAQSPEAQREIIVNPNTGEILRDLWIPLSAVSSSGDSRDLLDGKGGSGSGSGSDDDDDDDDDDNSGHGSDDGDDGDDNGGHGNGGGDEGDDH
jgi:hypothetical protein